MTLGVSIENGNALQELLTLINSEATKTTVTAAVAAEFSNRWSTAIDSKLSPARARDYRAGAEFSPTIVGPTAVLQLTGRYPQMIEHGNPQFDLRQSLLIEKGLKSRVIPFGHDVASASGLTGTPFGAPYAKERGKNAAKQIGKRMTAMVEAAKLQPGQRAPKQFGGKLFEHHAAPIYHKLTASRPNVGTNAPFKTFRTISLNSPAEKWIYPEKPGVKLIDTTMDSSLSHLGAVVVQTLNQIIGQFVATKRQSKGAAP
jgi:hypothetical protein